MSADLLLELADAVDKDRGHDKSLLTRTMREVAAELARVVAETDTLREREVRAIALTLAYSGAAGEKLGDDVPDRVWEALHDEGLVATYRDHTDEGQTLSTPEGFAALRAALAASSAATPQTQ